MPSVQVIKESQRKNIVCVGMFMHYFLYSSGMSLTPFAQLCVGSASGLRFLSPLMPSDGRLVCIAGEPPAAVYPLLAAAFSFSYSVPASPALEDAACLSSDITTAELNCRYQQRDSW